MNRKIVTAVCALGLSLSVMAQENGVVKKDEFPKVKQTEGYVSADYQAIDGGFGLGFNVIVNHFVFTGAFTEGQTNADITENNGWNIGVGYSHRYWLGKQLYIEGQAGVGYYHGSMKIKYVSGTKNNSSPTLGHYTTNTYSYKTESNGDFGMFLTPRIGLKLLKVKDTEWGVVAGYRWDFIKFKFNKDYTADYFTIGVMGKI